jgi:hypothetical protein
LNLVELQKVVIQQVGHLIVGIVASQVNFVANEDHRNFIINFDNTRHPVSQSPNTINVRHVINQQDNIGLLNLRICILLIAFV